MCTPIVICPSVATAGAAAASEASASSSAASRRRGATALLIRGQRGHGPRVGIQHADGGFEARARRVPDGAVARDGQLGLVGDLRRRVVRELLALRLEADQRAALAAVADPDVVV